MLAADLVDQQRATCAPAGRPAIGDDEADAGDRLPVELRGGRRDRIVIASKRMPGSRISFIARATSGALSHDAPICSNGRSVPRPSVRLVPSKYTDPG